MLIAAGVGLGVDGLADRVEEARVGVRREVHRDRGAGGERAGNLDVEQHLAVGALRIAAGLVGGAVDADRGDRRAGDAEAGEVRVELGLREAAAEFDDRDRLSGAVGARREGVRITELQRGVADRDAAAAAATRNWLRACGRSSMPSTAITRSASAAGRLSSPVRCRCVTSLPVAGPAGHRLRAGAEQWRRPPMPGRARGCAATARRR